MAFGKLRWVALAAALAAVVALAQPWSIAESRVEGYITARLSKQLGLSLTTSERGAVAFLPTPRVIANGVTATSADGSFEARIPRIRADISLLPLLTGRVEFTQILLFAPQVSVTFPDAPFDPLPALASTALATLPGTPHISVREAGSLFFRRGPGIISSARDVRIEIQSRAAGEPFSASGSLSWRGESVTFAVASNSAARSILPMARVRSDLVNLDFSSSRRSPATADGEPRAIEGQVQLTAPSMSRLGSWLASGSPVLLPLGATALTGTLSLSANAAEVRSAALTLGADLLEGALDWRKRGDRWRLTGTLAGKTLNIGRPQSGVSSPNFASFDLTPNQTIEIDDLVAHDIDLRLSLQRVRLPGLTLADVATQIMATENRLDIAVANSTLYRGAVRMRASVGRVPSGIEVRAQASGDRIDLAQFSSEFFEARRITGTGALQQQIEMSGRTLAELLGSAHGTFSFTARNGDFMGTNLNDAMRRIDRQPLAVMRDWRGGRTQFEELVLNGSIVNGLMEVSEGRVNGQFYRLTVGGLVSLPERAFKLAGNVHSNGAQSIIPFEITGSIGEPAVNVNTRALLQRSGAVAPFLDTGAAN